MNECRFCFKPSTDDLILTNAKGEELRIPACEHCGRIVTVIGSHIGGRLGPIARDLLTKDV